MEELKNKILANVGRGLGYGVNGFSKIVHFIIGVMITGMLTFVGIWIVIILFISSGS